MNLVKMELLILFKNKISELYKFRYMFYSLLKKNLFGKYRNSALGFLWNFVLPISIVLLYFIVFENFLGRGIPNYWLFLCINTFSFSFLNMNISNGSSCITSNSSLINKVCFPREILPLVQVTYVLITFLIEYIFMILIMVFIGYPLSWQCLLFLPILIILTYIFALGIVLLISSISVYIRDLEYFVTVLSISLMWITPVFYTISSTTGLLSIIVKYNPLTYYVISFQDLLYNGIIPSTTHLVLCTLFSFITVILGIVVFNKLKSGFAERI
jgi:lipopolysaccharide transport system permease protein